MAKFLKSFSILLLFISCGSQNEVIIPESTIDNVILRKKYNEQEEVFQDHEGKVISFEKYLEIIRKPENTWSSWAYVENGKRIRKLSSPIYQKGQLRYLEFAAEIEKLTSKNYGKKTIFLINYDYKDDLCSSTSSNLWDEHKIAARKKHLLFQKNKIEKKYNNLVYLNFFENEITLQNNPSDRKEHFFSMSKTS